MSIEPFVAKFNDSLVFTPEDLEPLDKMHINDTRNELGKYNIRGLSAEELVKTKFGILFRELRKPERRYFSMDLHDPVLQVRVEIKYENFYRTTSADVKFIRDVLLNPGESMYIYINLGCPDMPTIRYYHDNIYIINGRRLTWDMLYNLHISALERLNQSNDNGYALLRWWHDEEFHRKLNDAVEEYIRNNKDETITRAREEAANINKLLQRLRSTIEHPESKSVEPIDMIATFSTIRPEEDELDITTIERDKTVPLLEQINMIQTTPAVIDSSDISIRSNSQSAVLSYNDILSATLNDVDNRSDIETERDVVAYLTEVPYIQKLLCTIGCLPAYFFNRFVEICNHKNIRITHTQKSVGSLFPPNTLDKKRRQYKLEGNRNVRTCIRTFVYTPALRASIYGNPDLRRFDLNNQETDISIFINSIEYVETMRSTRTSDQDLASIKSFSDTSFVHIDKPSGKVISAMKGEETYPLMLRIARSFADYVNEHGAMGRENAYFRISDNNGTTVDYNVMRVLESIRETNEPLYRRINSEWFNDRLFDSDMKATNRRVMRWIDWCIDHEINFTEFNGILGGNGPSDLHSILAVLVNNQRKNSKNNPEYAKKRTNTEKEELYSFVRSKLHDIERQQLDLKRNAGGNFTSCISAIKR